MNTTTSHQWTVAEVAAHLGVQSSTVTAYLSRDQMPQPDGRLGRTPWWWADTIRAWRPAPAKEEHYCICDHCRDAGTCFGCTSGHCP